MTRTKGGVKPPFVCCSVATTGIGCWRFRGMGMPSVPEKSKGEKHICDSDFREVEARS